MSYLAVTKLGKYQHYKNRNPPWVKLHTTLLDVNHPMNQLPVATRYLFDRMLLLAANYDNSIPNDSELIAKLLRMEPRECREGIEQLLKGRWIVERRTKRRASKPASKPASEMLATETESRDRERTTAVERPLLETQKAPSQSTASLPFTQELLVSKLLDHIGGDADDRTAGVIRSYATHLNDNTLANVLESSIAKKPKNRAAYVVAALKAEVGDQEAFAEGRRMTERLKIHPRYQAAINKARLTDRQATVLDLYLRHHSMRRIGLALDITEATARGHLDAALRKIRPHLKDEAA